MIFSAPRYETLPPSVYPAKLAGVESRTGQNGEFLSWKFVVGNGAQPPITVTSLSSTAFSPKAKARQWIEALLGRQIEPGESIRLEDVLNRPCRLLLSIVQRDGQTYNQVDKVLPAEVEIDLDF